ncbi:MAG TPA: hypothetical protein VME66_09370, partial [Candidatus Acidoferrales bacterium]|nr:hypothetical protein [Candidatus Acidoferrales bacterium]
SVNRDFRIGGFPSAYRPANPRSQTARLSGATSEGIYEFTASNGLKYIGQSGNVGRRILQHLASGKLLAQDLNTVRYTEVLGGKTAREVAEQLRILEEEDGINISGEQDKSDWSGKGIPLT